MMSNQVAVVLQARMSSSRLPGKVLADISGRPLLQFLIERLKRSLTVDEIILATTDDTSDDYLSEFGKALGLKVVRGSMHDVLARYVLAASQTCADTLVRITCDCPFVDPNLLDEMINEFFSSEVDYLSNFTSPSYPDGLDIEIFSREVLLLAESECDDTSQREHVTPWIVESGRCRTAIKCNHIDLSGLRLTVDEPEDLEVIRGVVDYFEGDSDFHWQRVFELSTKKPELFAANAMFSRNEGAVMGEGQKLWRRAKRVIPGGNMLLSKRAEMFLPEQWPAYFS